MSIVEAFLFGYFLGGSLTIIISAIIVYFNEKAKK
jgi:hypothetical protein